MTAPLVHSSSRSVHGHAAPATVLSAVGEPRATSIGSRLATAVCILAPACLRRAASHAGLFKERIISGFVGSVQR